MAAAVSTFTAIHPTAADTGETVVTPTARTALGLTIYHDKLALVRESRTVPLHSGQNNLRFTDITNGVNPCQRPYRTITPSSVGYSRN